MLQGQISTQIKDECWFVYWSQTENTLMGFFCVGAPFHSHSEVQAAPPSTTSFSVKLKLNMPPKAVTSNLQLKLFSDIKPLMCGTRQLSLNLSLVSFIILIDLG